MVVVSCWRVWMAWHRHSRKYCEESALQRVQCASYIIWRVVSKTGGPVRVHFQLGLSQAKATADTALACCGAHVNMLYSTLFSIPPAYLCVLLR